MEANQVVPEWAERQAARLDAAPALAPKTQQGRDEVIDCLVRNCRNEDEARRVITAVLDGVCRCQNLTAEIAAIAREIRSPEQLPPGCAACKVGPGLWAPFVTTEHPGGFGSARCTCPRGKWLAAHDRNREATRG